MLLLTKPKSQQSNVHCQCIGNGRLTVDSWVWLKVTTLSSTASVLKDGRISLEIPSFYSKNILFKTFKIRPL